MPLLPGYQYITIDGYTLSVNPTEYNDPKAEKKITKVVTLTQTITQHWQVRASDKVIDMSWGNLPKADVDILLTKYEADYTSYTFTDIYGNSFTVVIDDFKATRRTSIDSDGFSAILLLSIITQA